MNNTSTAIANELVRQEWIAACRFQNLSDVEILREVARRAGETRDAVILLDLDSTLYEVGPRTHQILREWVESSEGARFPAVRPVIERLEHAHVGYSLRDTFAAAGLVLHADRHSNPQEQDDEVRMAWESAKKFWNKRFFTNEYLRYDRVYDGAVEFVRELYALGAKIVYLTGRDEPGMGNGTRARLIGDGFPFDTDRTHLLMKKSFELDDLEHKQAAASYVREHGCLVASFENEPPNVVAISDLFPGAMHIFLDTVCSDRPAEPRDGFYRLKGFPCLR